MTSEAERRLLSAIHPDSPQFKRARVEGYRPTRDYWGDTPEKYAERIFLDLLRQTQSAKGKCRPPDDAAEAAEGSDQR